MFNTLSLVLRYTTNNLPLRDCTVNLARIPTIASFDIPLDYTTKIQFNRHAGPFHTSELSVTSTKPNDGFRYPPGVVVTHEFVTELHVTTLPGTICPLW
jgi:hypothetical protein